ncbi:acyl-CoA : diacylglycerol acyltransferase [Candida dubliniensis CD36]|uniref:diacylglycerol O-acyltransferase n=1 Tax=Candida dubliniensis (strain CD36 / ATCC MYA-646 / CBS 7987 / NCPF 3949 / NRRL Y-17841) TaxID=573826 RepID=B9WDX9_CANDC|nr:acyl-CoA : diacylglycerol acyltransferase [Candida dubliniensis CD36]CAX42888.1 acyl-CoA : diacylglycerol acyltransferase [Candida dubliniensis CD36]
MTETADLKSEHTEKVTGLSTSKEVPESTLTQRKQSSAPATPSSKRSTTSKKKRAFINVAPLNTPLSHRLETLGVVWHCISIPFFICLFFFMISLGLFGWIVIVLPYFIWWYGFDLHTPTNGKVAYRYRNSMKNFIIWDWFVRYFPIKVYKSVELEPTFKEVLVEETESSEDDDEQDLVSERSRTLVDKVFKFFGLKKRLNDTSSGKSETYKTVSTGPRYIFGYHPHGVISMGGVGLFATNSLRNEPYTPFLKFLKPFFHDSTKGERLFPGLGNIFLLTITTQFAIPFYRDYLMGLGVTSASAKNIRSLINNGDNSVCIVVGGAEESLLNNMVAKHARVGYGYKENQDINGSDTEDDEPEQQQQQQNGNVEVKKKSTKEVDNKTSSQPPKREVKLILNKRKGFVKLAIELGNVALVPTFAFGEADVYRLVQPSPTSMMYKFQKWMKGIFSFTIPLFSARGVFIYDYGLLPFRNPINICVGKPIYIPAGALQEYKQQHPEEFTEEETKPPMKKSGSFTDIFKINDETPKISTIKTKIPPALLDKYHKLYVDELRNVYEENKHKFGYGDVEFSIVE